MIRVESSGIPLIKRHSSHKNRPISTSQPPYVAAGALRELHIQGHYHTPSPKSKVKGRSAGREAPLGRGRPILRATLRAVVGPGTGDGPGIEGRLPAAERHQEVGSGAQPRAAPGHASKLHRPVAAPLVG